MLQPCLILKDILDFTDFHPLACINYIIISVFTHLEKYNTWNFIFCHVFFLYWQTCAKCKAHRKCTKTFSIQRFPKILVLHLKRFSGERYRSKLSTKVNFDLRGLDLSKFTVESEYYVSKFCLEKKTVSYVYVMCANSCPHIEKETHIQFSKHLNVPWMYQDVPGCTFLIMRICHFGVFPLPI